MILIPAWIFTLLASFAELVGREAAAAIRRRQAGKEKKERAAKRREKLLRKLRAKRLAEAIADYEREEKSRRIQQELKAKIHALCAEADPDPYGEGE